MAARRTIDRNCIGFPRKMSEWREPMIPASDTGKPIVHLECISSQEIPFASVNVPIISVMPLSIPAKVIPL